MTDLARLVLDTDTKGLKDGQRELDALARSSERTAKEAGSSMKRLGQSIGGALKVGFLAAGAAAVTAGGFFVKAGFDALEAGKAISTAARLANASTTEFQRFAVGAQTVGIENDKLADILKDVNDRVGDFLSTGGGPMADFFENIGPKVGVTAEQFKNLSGPDALQLYVKSLQDAGLNQQEMTFYMEAMASDATALIPLLKDNGAAMTAMGDAAQASGRIMSEDMIKRLGEAKQTLDNTKAAFSQMATVMAGEAILAVIDYIKTLEPMIKQAQELGRQVWEYLAPSFQELAKAVVSLMSGPFGKALIATLKFLGTVIGTTVVVAIKVFVTALTLMAQDIDRVFRAAKTFIDNFTNGWRVISELVPQFVKNMVDGVTGWLQGKLFSVLRDVISRVQIVSDAFFRLYDAVVGNSYVPDMVEGIAEWMAKLDAGMVTPALNATEATREAFEALRGDVERIMESLMTDSERAARQFVNDSRVIKEAMATGGLGQREGQMALAGIAGVGLVNDGDYRLEGFGDMLNGLVTASETASVRVVESFRDMADKTLQSFSDVAQSIRGGGFLDILGSVIGLGIQLGSVGAFGRGVQGRINSVPGRANGGMVSAGQSYLVGENRPEIFTPNANGFISPNAQGSGGGVAMIIPSPYFDVVVDGRVQKAAPSIAMSGASMAGVKASRSQSRRVR